MMKEQDSINIKGWYKSTGSPKGAIAISGGHFGKGTGASGIVDEVTEVWKIAKAVAALLKQVEVLVVEFYDTVSKIQRDNINRIVKWHNQQKHILDVSFHLNVLNATSNGCEVLYLTEQTLTTNLSNAISKAGDFKNRGAEKRTDLGFLNNTAKPAVLLEPFFVTNAEDVTDYNKNFDAIVFVIAKELAKYVGVTITKDEPKPAKTEPATLIKSTQKEEAKVANLEVFKDVSKDRFSHDAIASIKELGLMNGFEDGTFKPNEPVTREQLAVVLDRLLKVLKK